VELDQKTAGLLCAAIVSDTLMYRSPTCTSADRDAAEKLAAIAGIDPEELASNMFRAGSNLKSKGESEIFYQDFKKFSMNDLTFGIGQINSMNSEELKEIKIRLKPFMEELIGKGNVQMLFFMLTDIINESTELLYTGTGAKELIESAFNIQPVDESFVLNGVVSRKKQLIPVIMSDLQQ